MSAPISAPCTLPGVSYNSQFIIDGVNKEDGVYIELGTVFTLRCEQGYTFKNTNQLVETCTEGLQTTDIRNECFSKFPFYIEL